MISATVAAWALPVVERWSISCPARLRFREALKVAMRTSGGWPPDGAAGAAGEAAPVAMAVAATSSAASVRRIGRVRITSTSGGDRSLDEARYCYGAPRVAPRSSPTVRAALRW